MEISKNIITSNGDELQISLLPLDNRYLSDEAHAQLEDQVDILMVELDRIAGTGTINYRVLSAITKVVADVFIENQHVIICFLCDFLSPIPSTKKKITCQEYRSRIFSKLFERYVSTNQVASSVTQTIVAIDGVDEKFYIHIIARREHEKFVQVIRDDTKSVFDK